MTICSDWIEKMKNILPERCSTKDLVDVGIFTSPYAACYARKIGNCPPFFKFGGRIMFPKEGVIEWMEGKKHENSETKGENCK